jgi:glyoxylate reductase
MQAFGSPIIPGLADWQAMERVFVARPVPGRAADRLRAAGFEVDQWPADEPPPPAVLAGRASGASGVLAMLTDRFDAAVFAACPRLRVVANMAVGYDNLDARAAAEAGVWVTNTPGVLAETTADFAFGLLLATARRIVEGDAAVRAGEWKTWSPTAHLGVDVHGATLGIIGMGEIGQGVAQRARGFGMVSFYSSRRRRHELEEPLGITWRPFDAVLEESDFVTLHVPLSAETRHLIGAAELERMKATAILINTSRGGVVDQGALIDAVRAGRIAGAGLDVTDPEPLPPDSPLLALPNVVVTPHIASASVATRSRMAEMAAANIIAVLQGREPPNAVNRPARPRQAV